MRMGQGWVRAGVTGGARVKGEAKIKGGQSQGWPESRAEFGWGQGRGQGCGHGWARAGPRVGKGGVKGRVEVKGYMGSKAWQDQGRGGARVKGRTGIKGGKGSRVVRWGRMRAG